MATSFPHSATITNSRHLNGSHLTSTNGRQENSQEATNTTTATHSNNNHHKISCKGISPPYKPGETEVSLTIQRHLGHVYWEDYMEGECQLEAPSLTAHAFALQDILEHTEKSVEEWRREGAFWAGGQLAEWKSVTEEGDEGEILTPEFQDADEGDDGEGEGEGQGTEVGEVAKMPGANRQEMPYPGHIRDEESEREAGDDELEGGWESDDEQEGGRESDDEDEVGRQESTEEAVVPKSPVIVLLSTAVVIVGLLGGLLWWSLA